MFVMIGFIMITPLDIIMQSLSKNAAALKLFIIIAACACFVFVGILFYFSRLYRSRVVFNQIPSKSVYLPLEKNDLPPSVLSHIEKTLRLCVGDIKVRAGPLANEKELFNYAGRVAPSYIQRRNIDMGLQSDFFFLDEDYTYQDLIDSVGLKLRIDGLIANTYSVPKYATFREIFVSALPENIDNNEGPEELVHAVRRSIYTYEKAKFSGQLLSLEEIVEFFVDLQKVVHHFYSVVAGDDRGEFPITEARRYSLSTSRGFNRLDYAYRKDRKTVQDPDYDGSIATDETCDYQPRSSLDSGKVAPYLASSLSQDLEKSDGDRRSTVYRVRSGFGLTSSVLRVPFSKSISRS